MATAATQLKQLELRVMQQSGRVFTGKPPCPVEWARECGLEPDPWQARMLKSNKPQILLNCSRQVGKSTVSAALAGHHALYTPGALVLLVSPSLRQSVELFRKVLGTIKAHPALPVAITDESALRIEMSNGSRIISLPGSSDTVRGFSKVTLLLLDEAAFIPDALFVSLRPMLAVSRGRIVMLSSPNGKRGAFYECWEKGGDAWQRFQVTAHECPRIDPDWLERERSSMSAAQFRQEFECSFEEAFGAVFSAEHIEAATQTDYEPLFADV